MEQIIILFKHKYCVLLFFLLSLFDILAKNKLESVYKEITKYIQFNLEFKLNHTTSEFYKRENPIISIVISTFNGEVYIKPAVRSVHTDRPRQEKQRSRRTLLPVRGCAQRKRRRFPA